MQLRQILKISVAVLVCLLFVLSAAVAVHPLLKKLYAAEELPSGQNKVQDTDIPPEQPEIAKLQIFYVMEAETTELSAVYAEVLNLAENRVVYFEIPVYTKITLSQDLYQKLKAHSPGLPQYMKLSGMAENFSEEYRMEGCQEILSEALGIPAVHWVALNEEEWQAWQTAVSAEPKADTEFFTQYTKLLANTESDESSMRRWQYYEGYLNGIAEWKGKIPGTETTGGFEIQKTQTKEALEQCLQYAEGEKE